MRSDPWLPYTLSVEIEAEFRKNVPGNTAFSFSAEDYCNVVQSISAAGMSNSADPEAAMRTTAAFFKTLSKEVLLRRCYKIAALYNVLKRIEEQRITHS